MQIKKNGASIKACHSFLFIQYVVIVVKRENPTGWRLWGLHRDGNIDRFLGANVLYGLFLSHMFGIPQNGIYVHAIYG
jgi:hypothetical protein